MKSFSSTNGDDESAAVAINFPNEPWAGDFLFKQIGSSFSPALGFVNRTSIRQYVGTVTHLTRFRNAWLNTIEFGADFELVTDLNDVLESRENDVLVRFRSRIGDQATIRAIQSFEYVPALFFLPKQFFFPLGVLYVLTGLTLAIVRGVLELPSPFDEPDELDDNGESLAEESRS
jgi:hypothetical protein